MPLPDPAPRRTSQERLRLAQERALAQELAVRFADRNRRPDDGAGESVPVDPNRPNNLSGGAAAALGDR
jgi:hypothetical protein